MLARLDLRVASVHSKLRMDAAPMTKRMIGAIKNPRMNVLGHCTGRMVMGNRGTRPPSSFDAKAVFEACVEHDVAVEINSRPERRDPPTKLLELARDIGCLFSIDSDAHAPGQLDFQQYGCERAHDAGIDPDRIVNTWPRERLLGVGQPPALAVRADGGWADGATVSPCPRTPRWRYAVPSGAAARSRRTARATGSSC